MQRYVIHSTQAANPLALAWDAPEWQAAETAAISNFRVESSDHRPVVQARVLYNARGLFVRFRVEDQYIRCVAEKLNDSVCCDSCVEFFIEPAGKKGYLNFEFSGNGIFLCHHVRDHRRAPQGFADFSPLMPTDVREVEVITTLPGKVEPEIVEKRCWELGFFAPFSLFTAKTGAPAPMPGTEWRGNFYKCGDKTSHPHWASWNPVPELNFHLPESFGILEFR